MSISHEACTVNITVDHYDKNPLPDPFVEVELRPTVARPILHQCPGSRAAVRAQVRWNGEVIGRCVRPVRT